MQTSDIKDPLFRSAVEAIDSGNIDLLRELLTKHPDLLSKRLDFPSEGYFQRPYLLWFVADNPIRHEKLPSNIIEITSLLISFAKKFAGESLQEQVDQAFRLVATGRIPKECGVQIGLLDLLLDQGATPGDAHDALAHGNLQAAEHIILRTGHITLTEAVCLDRSEDVKRLLLQADSMEKQVALMAAAFYGKTSMISLVINWGADVNAYIDGGFHAHASPLHQAVSSGSLEAVKLLVEAGANLHATDKMYGGTPLGWARHMQSEQNQGAKKEQYREIENFLAGLETSA